MKVTLNYGDGTVDLQIPEKNLAGTVAPKKAKTAENSLEELNRVLANPYGPALTDIVKGKSVCVLVEDHTRDEPRWALLSAVAPKLKDARRVHMIKQASADAGLENYKVKIHDCQEPDMADLGTTSRGTPVIVNAAAVGHDVYVPLADMKAHYFSGYSNAIKDFLPGVCGFASIEANHSMALDPKSTFGTHPYHPDPARRTNPLADDMREAAEMIAKGATVFTLSTVSNGDKVVWAGAGRMEPVIADGIKVLDETASFTVTARPRIVVSPGGYPQDKSLYHAQRALELTKNAVSEGGEILFLAECRDGVAPKSAMENFYNRLTAPLDTVIESISGKYHLYEHKAYKFAELLKNLSSIQMFTELDKETVESAHLDKAENPQAVIDEWTSNDPDVKILVLDKGNKLAIYST
jgi:nickel-dependent lactate racemase